MNNSAILLAGGKGSRMKNSVADKCLEPLLGVPVILHSVKAFVQSGCVNEIVFVCRDDLQEASIKNICSKLFIDNNINAVYARGGKERFNSVLNGIKASNQSSNLVFIHDSARPLVRCENIKQLCEAASENKAAVLAAKVVDTIKRNDSYPDNKICKLSDLNRDTLYAMQTPQVFERNLILSAYEKVVSESIKITDDVAAASIMGAKIAVVENNFYNPKITVPEDIALAEYIIQRKK